MPADLSNQNISLTYSGLLHAQGDRLPTSNQVIITDGVGTRSSIALGVSGQGMTVTGLASVNELSAISCTTHEISALRGTYDEFLDAPSTAKAWVVFSGNDGTIRSSLNVNSVTRNAAGDYSITFETELQTADYAATLNLSYDNLTPYMVCSHVKAQPAPATTGFGVRTYRLVGTTPTQFDPHTVSAVVFHINPVNTLS